MKLKFTYMGRSYHASTPLPDALEVPDKATVDVALRTLAGQLPKDLSLADSCLVVVSGKHLGTIARHEDCTLTAADEIVLIAPVAGG